MSRSADGILGSVRASVPAVVVDVAVAVLATAAALTIMTTSREAGAVAPDLVAWLLLTGAGASLVVRRRWPGGVLVTVIAVTMVYLARDYPGGAELPLTMAALYTAMAERRRVIALLVLAWVGATSIIYRVTVEGHDPSLVIVTVSLVAMAAMLGEATRTRRDLRAEVRQRLRALEVEKELEKRTQLIDERLRIARELHDVLAHTITAISVQAGAAADGVDRGSASYEALRRMRTTAQEAMQQLRVTISVLRSEDDEGELVPAPDLRGLDELLRNTRAAGPVTQVHLDGEPRALPAEVELTAFRIVQEALTNVIRHAEASEVTVRIRYGASTVHLEVVDDGRARPSGTRGLSEGHGIIGMRERAEALGGSLRAAARPQGGFEVAATLPTGEEAR